MTRVAIRVFFASIVFVAALALIFFTGCGNKDENNPPLASSPSAAGTYYGIADLGGGDGQQKEDCVKLHLRQSSSVSMGGNSPLHSLNVASESLEGYIAYGDTTYLVYGMFEGDSLGFIWTTELGNWMFTGNFDAQGIHGQTSGPTGSDPLILYRRTGSTRNIADKWLGRYSNGACWPYGGSLRAYLSQSDSVITGNLIVSGTDEMGDTLSIHESMFYDPILNLTAVDSDFDPPVRLHLMGTMVSADSMAGTFDWWWDRCLDEGIWYLTRVVVDTARVFADIMGVAYRRESVSDVSSFVYFEWRINQIGIPGATISVNGIPLTDYGDGFYSNQPGAITVVPGGDYVYNIFHPDYGSKVGTAHVPGDYAVISPVEGGVILRGQNLVVNFTQAPGATFYDSYLETNGAYTLIPAPAASLSLSGTSIQTAGADTLNFEAVCGDYETFTGFFGVNAKAINVTVQ